MDAFSKAPPPSWKPDLPKHSLRRCHQLVRHWWRRAIGRPASCRPSSGHRNTGDVHPPGNTSAMVQATAVARDFWARGDRLVHRCSRRILLAWSWIDSTQRDNAQVWNQRCGQELLVAAEVRHVKVPHPYACPKRQEELRRYQLHHAASLEARQEDWASK